MGFWDTVGELSGGAARGMSRYDADRAQRAQAEQAEYETQQKREIEARAQALEDAVAGAPVPGQSRIGLGGVDYQLQQQAAAREAAAAAAQDAQEPKGLVGKVLGLLTPRELRRTARGAGMGSDHTAAGQGFLPEIAVQEPARTGGIVPTTSGEPTNLPGTTAEKPTGPVMRATGGVPETPKMVPIADTNGQLLREATDIDRDLYLARAYAKARMIPEANAAYASYKKKVNDRHIANLPFMDDAQINGIVEKVLPGARFSRGVAEDGSQTYNLSRVTKDAEGKEVLQPIYANMGIREFQARLDQDMDDDQRHTVAVGSKNEKQAALESAARLKGLEATTARTEGLTAGTKVDTDAKIAEAKKQAEFDAQTAEMTATPDEAMTNPKWDQWAGNGFYQGKKPFEGKVTIRNADGTYEQKTINNAAEYKKERQAAWNADPYVTNKIAKMVDAGNGKLGYAAYSPKGDLILFPSEDALFNYVTANHPDPVKSGTALKATLAKRAKDAEARARIEKQKAYEATPVGIAEKAKREAAAAAEKERQRNKAIEDRFKRDMALPGTARAAGQSGGAVAREVNRAGTAMGKSFQALPEKLGLTR